MEILYYTDLDYSRVKAQFAKTISFLKNGDFRSAEIKKMPNTGYHRAKLDYENRLLFKFARFNNQTYILLLEVILNHDYSKSRFLRGAEIDENKLKSLSDISQIAHEDIPPISFVNPRAVNFHILDKIISFDNDQQEIFNLPAPLIIIGSAGSGKTALTLEKIKTLKGNLLYITLSSFLVENSANLYYSYHYNNENQEIDFLSFKEFVETLQIAAGKEINFNVFEGWFIRHRNTTKIRDAHKLFEEFKGVITGQNIEKEYLSKDEYIQLGIRQSVFPTEEREGVYDLFEKYLQFLKESNYYDLNHISYQRLALCKPKYDFIIVDEVQDFTNIQLYLILKSLNQPDSFILCGDSNQIVHPNFFSWSNVKTMFYKNALQTDVIRILKTNYRNSLKVTQLANNLLKIKNLRFGSIDKESTYLVDAISSKTGEVIFLEDSAKIKQDLNRKTQKSTHFAVLVMRNEDKNEARKSFNTPLVFSIQEAKGLEYENIILVNFISNNDKEFREIVDGVSHADLNNDEDLIYSRAKDKADKSLQVYKFYINSLYVAITRAIQNLYIIESTQKHEILSLLNLVDAKQHFDMKAQASSMEDWKKEAHKLEMQGKKEQADLIKKSMFGLQIPNWKPITAEILEDLKKEAFNTENFNNKAKNKLFDYALIHNDIEIKKKLSEFKYRKADDFENERGSIYRKHYQYYKSDDVKKVTENINKYGVDYRDEFNLTPLLIAVMSGAVNIINYLLEMGADTNLADNFGKNPLQIALYQSYLSKNYATGKLNKIYHPLVTDSIKVKIDNHLVKIDNHKAEYFILNYLIALQSSLIKQRMRWEARAIKMDDFVYTLSFYPSNVLPEYRKQRSYINSIIAKNEVTKEDPTNKKLFLRIYRGYYLLNPELEILIKDEWVNVYDLMRVERVAMPKEDDLIAEQKKEIESLEKEIAEFKKDGNTHKLKSEAVKNIVSFGKTIAEINKMDEAKKVKSNANKFRVAIEKEKNTNELNDEKIQQFSLFD